MLRQFIRSTIRDWAVCRTCELCPSRRPATTTLITPEALISSATTYAANGVRKLRPLSIRGSVTCVRTNPITAKNASPTAIPPPAATRKSRASACHATVATIAVRRATSAVASLSSDSPSRIVTMRRGRPMRRPIVVAATASGGATTAPIAKAAGQPRSGRSALTRTATPAVVKATSPTDNSRIDRRLALKSTRLVCRAAAYSSGGSRPKSTISGSSCTSGTNGRYDPMTPTMIRTSGEGRSNLELRPETAMTTVTIPTSVRTTCMPSSSRMPLPAFPTSC